MEFCWFLRSVKFVVRSLGRFLGRGVCAVFCQLSKSFTVVIQPLSTRLIKPNFCFDLSHRRSTTVSLETRNSFFACDPTLLRK